MFPSKNTYDECAVEYAQMMTRQEKTGVEPNSIMARFLQVVGDVSGLTVLDAGCGEGYLSRILAQRGAHVTGIDVAPRLIELARTKEAVGQINYQQADLSQPLPAYLEHFDLAASFFVLNDVYDYRGFLRTLGSVLKQTGRLVLFMNNPYSLMVRGHTTDYFADSGQVFPYRGLAEAGVKVHFYHRTLEEYLTASFAAGFQLEQLVDVPTPEGSFQRRRETLIPEGYHFPFFTILSFRKA
ncbi:class I SAM-dependent methyltransferase [Ktedonosporobacter rubrisoli]|uniref:Class I SAM-dependent methyltransferase n=1 Tax=Ktedonosporobacter rubrisoli TaxID=2509675 RepID=A0A4P6JNE2_KTERU|nr:class I SAM-dependent methyltransferase [Ktedonosporobacter rubrisoli]QBD76246.1 class I SAM-dependent methyltransferase [Ktedonosporobacter rubrisoli]